MADLSALRTVVALLAQPGVLEMTAVFQPFVVNEGVFVRSENGKFGLRLVRPETGEEAVLDLNALPALLDEIEVARAAPLCGEHQQFGKSHDGECFGCDLAAARDNDVRGMGIIEAAIRSPSIADYMSHWEGRCLKAEAENVRLREAIRLEGEDAEFYFLSDPACRLYANLNDTFGYAVADAEPIPWEEFDAVIAAWRQRPVSLVLWAARKRGYDLTALVTDVGVPPSTRDALKAALEADHE